MEKISFPQVFPQTPFQENYSSEEINKKNYSSNYSSSINATQADKVMESVSDLVSNPAYKPFFFKRLYAMGATQFLKVADTARKNGKQPPRMFVLLLQEHGRG